MVDKNLSNAIQWVNVQLEDTKENYYYKQFKFLSGKVDGLEKLKALLEKKATDETVDLNSKIETQDSDILSHDSKKKSHSVLNFAVMYCKAEVVKYLLENGATPDHTTIHHATRGYNRDMDNVVAVLKNHHVDLNSLNKKGETALYKAIRKRDDIRAKEATVSLKKHGASMLFFEKFKAPLLNQKDKIQENCDNVLLNIFAPLRGC